MSVWYDFKKDLNDKYSFESIGYGRDFFGEIKQYVTSETYLNDDEEYPWYKLNNTCLCESEINQDNDYYEIIQELFIKAQQNFIWIKYYW